MSGISWFRNGKVAAVSDVTNTNAGDLRGPLPVNIYDDAGNIISPSGSASTGTNAQQVKGNFDAGDTTGGATTFPVLISAEANNPDSPPANVAVASRVNLFADLAGRLVVYLGTKLDKTNDAITAWVPQSASSNTPAIVTSAGDALVANANRKAWRVQNLGTNPLFVRLATGASTTVFHMILRSGTANDDGTGGIIEDDQWLGVVSVAGTSPRFVVTELT